MKDENQFKELKDICGADEIYLRSGTGIFRVHQLVFKWHTVFDEEIIVVKIIKEIALLNVEQLVEALRLRAEEAKSVYKAKYLELELKASEKRGRTDLSESRIRKVFDGWGKGTAIPLPKAITPAEFGAMSSAEFYAPRAAHKQVEVKASDWHTFPVPEPKKKPKAKKQKRIKHKDSFNAKDEKTNRNVGERDGKKSVLTKGLLFWKLLNLFSILSALTGLGWWIVDLILTMKP